MWHPVGVVLETTFISPPRSTWGNSCCDLLFACNAEPFKYVVFQDEGSSSHWQLALERVEVMSCKRVQLCSQRGWPEVDGVGFHRGYPLTHFDIFGCLWRLMGLLKIYSVPSDVYLIYSGLFSESQWSVCKMQRRQSGRTVGPDQFLWIQHTNVCSSCQFAW